MNSVTITGFLPWQMVSLFIASGIGAGLLWLVLRRNRHLHAVLDALENEREANSDRIFQLSEQAELYRNLVEEHGDLIVRRDADSKIIFANQAFLDLVAELNVPPQTVIGARFDLAGETSRLTPARDGHPMRYEQQIATRQGSRWIAFVEAPFRDEETGRVLHQAVGRDVTERRLAEAASEAKSRFLATVSHEIRTPLNGVLGMAQLLKQTNINAEQATYIDAIKTSGEALLSLIEQILDFSRIESGRLDMVAEPFDLHALTESVIELLAPRAQDKGLEIALLIAPDVPQYVVSDSNRLRQILTNLCGNAIKFTESGGVGVTLATDVDGKILFSVSDTGIGIPENRLVRIFEEFEQADGSHTRRFEGTGLGLAISQKIALRLGGSISVTSRVGKGSTFSVRLALPPQVDETMQATLQATLNENSVRMDDIQVLVVGKSPFEAPFLAQRLRDAGAMVTLCKTIEQALQEMSALNDRPRRKQPDMLIVDAALGVPSKALANLAKAAGVETRIILLSPFERQSFGSPTEAGFNGYLTKPVRARSLFARLNREGLRENLGGGDARLAMHPQLQKTTEDSPKAQTLPLAGKRVLLAEDNEINALLVSRTLSRAGAEVIVTRDGLEALAAYEKMLASRDESYDLVLLDMRMPGLDGIQTVKRMRIAENLTDKPSGYIVALTANAFAEDKAACLGAGFDVFMTKPLDIEALLHLVADGGKFSTDRTAKGKTRRRRIQGA